MRVKYELEAHEEDVTAIAFAAAILGPDCCLSINDLEELADHIRAYVRNYRITNREGR